MKRWLFRPLWRPHLFFVFFFPGGERVRLRLRVLLLLLLLSVLGASRARAGDCLPNLAADFGPLFGPDFAHAHAIGPACPDAAAFTEGGELTLEAGGFDIGPEGDQFLYAYNEAAGDFSARVTFARREWVPGSRLGRAGIMARASCAERARYSFLHDPGAALEDSTRLAHRPTEGGRDDFEIIPEGAFLHAATLRLDRKGNVFVARVLDEEGLFGGEPGTWTEIGRNDWGPDAPASVLLGLAANSHSGCKAARIAFRDWEVAAPPLEFRRGDVDGDGAVGAFDVFVLAGHIFGGIGRRPPCAEAADVDDNGALAAGDVTALVRAVLDDSPLPAPGREECGEDPRSGLPGSLDCGSYRSCDEPLPPPPAALGWAYTTGAPVLSGRPGHAPEVPVTVFLENAAPVQVWSLSLRSTCRVVEVSTAGTVAAADTDDPPGLRTAGGFHRAEILPGGRGVTAVTALAFSGNAAFLDPDAGPHPVLRLSVEAEVPFGSCSDCALLFEDGLVPEVTNAALVGGAPLGIAGRDGVAQVCCGGPDLLYGGELDFVLDPRSPALCVRVPPPDDRRGDAVLITLSAPEPGGASGANAVYARWGEEGPTPAAFDAAADERSRAEQSLVLPYVAAQPLGILVLASAFGKGGKNLVTLRVERVQAALTGMSPSSGAAGSVVEATVSGGRFEEGMALVLRNAETGDELPAVAARITRPDRVRVTYEPGGAPLGEHDLVLRLEDGTEASVLEDAFFVHGPEERPMCEVELEGPASYRNGELSRMILRYTNVGRMQAVAPILEISGPQAVIYSIDETDNFHQDRVQVLGVDLGGGGTIAPGEVVEVPVYFELQHDLDEGSDVEFTVRKLTPRGEDPLAWSALPRPEVFTAAEWAAITAAYEQRLGPTWSEYNGGLGALATALAARGFRTNSVAALLNFVTREISGEPTASITGWVRNVDDVPLDGVNVLARRPGPGGALVAASQSVRGGLFFLNWLEMGATYRLAADGFQIRSGNELVTVSDASGAAVVELVIEPDTVPTQVGCPGCEPPPFPGAPPPLPEEHSTLVASALVPVLFSRDPNSKEDEDVQGPDTDPFPESARPGEELGYRINFQNLAAGKGGGNTAARRVVVTDELDKSLDWRTFRFLQAGFGEEHVDLGAPEAESPFCGPPPAPASGGAPPAASGPGESYLVAAKACVPGASPPLFVRITGELQEGLVEERRAKWTFETFEDEDFTVPASMGFLPPEDGDDETHESEGFVTFSVKVREDLTSEVEIRNTAAIRFDENAETLVTPAVVTAVTLVPEPPAHPNPPDGATGVPPGVRLQWDPPLFAGSFRVSLERDGAAGPPLEAVVSAPSFEPPAPLEPGALYRWQVVSQSPAVPPRTAAGALWSFRTAGTSFVRGDVNGDGQVGGNVTDVVYYTNWAFLGSGPAPPCFAAADVNGDGQVGGNVTDVVYYTNWAFLGGPEPPAPFPGCGGGSPVDLVLGCDVLPPDCR